jgi:nicotinamidase-related amidase
MCARSNSRAYECVLVDVNTQIDFCDDTGASPVRNIPDLIPALRRIVAWAKRNSVPVVSSLESHRPLELSDSGTPICCVDGSSGQRKLDFTVFPARTNIEVDNTFAVPCDLFKKYQQAIFQKRSSDLLLNPKADRLLTQLPVREYLLFGAGLEGSVKSIALALMARSKPVAIVVDACGYWDASMAELALRQLSAKGARVVRVDEILQRRLPRPLRYPGRRIIALQSRPSRIRLSFNRKTVTATGGNGSSSNHANGHSQSTNGHPRRNSTRLSPAPERAKMPKRKNDA